MFNAYYFIEQEIKVLESMSLSKMYVSSLLFLYILYKCGSCHTPSDEEVCINPILTGMHVDLVYEDA